MLKSLTAALAAFLLAGCAAQIGATTSAATLEGRALKDTEARALIDSTCLIGIGAWARLTNPSEQVGSMLLCGGSMQDLTTVRAGNVTVDLGDN